MTLDSLLYPTPADLSAWASANPALVKPEDAEALRAALAEAVAAGAALVEAKAQLEEARLAVAHAQMREQRAFQPVYRAAPELRAPYAAAVLPVAVVALVDAGWVDVTSAVVAVPSGGYGRSMWQPPSSTHLAALAQYKAGAKTASIRLLTAHNSGMAVKDHELRLDDFAIVGWPREGCSILDPAAARAALGILEPKAKKGGAR